MAIKTPFDAVISQFGTRLEQMGKYIQATPALAQDQEIAHFGFQWLLVAYWAFVEDLYKSFLFFGVVFQHEEFRAFLKGRMTSAEKRKELKAWTDVQLARYAQKACSFEENAKKLRGYCGFLFKVPPFPDDDTDRLITDLAKVRNLVVHHGGLPEEAHAKDIRTPGIVVPTAKVGQHQFYRLNLDAQIVVNFLAVGVLVVQHLDHAVKAHAKLAR